MNVYYAVAILGAICWGLGYTIDEKLMDKASPMMLVSITGLISLLMGVSTVLYREGPAAYVALLQDRNWFLMLLVGQILTAVTNWLIYVSIDRLGAAHASIIEISYPLFVVLFSILLFRTSLTWPTILGGLLIFAGSAVIVTQSQS